MDKRSHTHSHDENFPGPQDSTGPVREELLPRRESGNMKKKEKKKTGAGQSAVLECWLLPLLLTKKGLLSHISLIHGLLPKLVCPRNWECCSIVHVCPLLCAVLYAVALAQSISSLALLLSLALSLSLSLSHTHTHTHITPTTRPSSSSATFRISSSPPITIS